MITYTVPIAGLTTTNHRLIKFAADPVARKIVCIFESGTLVNGNFVKLSENRREFDDASTPSFNDFVANCPAVANLRRQVEQYETGLDRAGTVD